MSKGKNSRTYQDDFKKDAISLALRSSSISSTAKDLGIPEGTLHTWIKNPKLTTKDNKNPNAVNLLDEVKQLRKENARLKEEKEILKKAAAYFARETK